MNFLSRELDKKLSQATVVECFSQNKDELIIACATRNKEDFYIKAHLKPGFCCLSFPDNFRRARKNSVGLFKALLTARVIKVYQYLNERCFSLNFDNGQYLLFKMHGNRANVVLIDSALTVKELFKNNLQKDWYINLKSLDRQIDQGYEALLKNEGDYRQLFPTFGKVVNDYLARKGYAALGLRDKYTLLQRTLDKLTSKPIYVTKHNPQLTLIKPGQPSEEYGSAIKAINHFFLAYIGQHSLQKEKSALTRLLESRINKSENYIAKSLNKLDDLQGNTNYQQLGDLLMANLHQIKTGATEASVSNFYNGNRPIKIKLKSNLSPQLNAEAYYRKAKNQVKEIDQLERNIHQKEILVDQLKGHLKAIHTIPDVKTLRSYIKENKLLVPNEKTEGKSRPYHLINIAGFDIYVGKSAKHNDKLLQQHSYKEDLWLHAKDVPGSHVLIKHQAGKEIPKVVIEKAAALAAFYSKRRNDSLCPVIVTPRKFVRKRKGDPPGAVVVDKEDVILIEPGKQEGQG